MNLYKLKTGLGIYWSVATSFDDAKKKVEDMLGNADYGFSDDRKVTEIEFIAEAPTNPKFVTKKTLAI